MAVGDKQFNSARYMWLTKNKDSDPKLQDLSNRLTHTWFEYIRTRDELDTLYYADTFVPQKVSEFQHPWL